MSWSFFVLDPFAIFVAEFVSLTLSSLSFYGSGNCLFCFRVCMTIH